MKFSRGGVAAAVLAVVVAGVCIRLGFWQLDRLEQRRAANAALRSALALPALELPGDSLAALTRDPARFVNRPVRVEGRYIPDADVVLRGRAHQGRPGVHLVTPLRIAGSDSAVLVNRGWVPSPDAASVAPEAFREPDAEAVTGILQRVPVTGEESLPRTVQVEGRAVQTYRRLDLSTLQEAIGAPLLPLYVQQLPEDPARTDPPLRVPLPEMDEGPHLGYAIQWFSFAAIAVGGFLLLAFRRTRKVPDRPL